MSAPFPIRHLVLAAVGLSAAALAGGYALAGAWPWIAASLGLGAAWLIAQWRRLPPAAPLGFAAVSVLACASAWLSTGPGGTLFAVLAVVAALCAWDLDGLAQRLERYPFVGDQGRLGRQHLRRLLAVAAGGLVLAAITLALQIRLTLLPALLLALLAVFGLGWAVFLLRAQNS